MAVATARKVAFSSWAICLIIGLCSARPSARIAGRGALCEDKWQSPINIEPTTVRDSSLQVRFQYNRWRPENVKSIKLRSNDGPARIDFEPSLDLGYIQVGDGYNDFDEYALTSLEVLTPSEHTFRHASWPVEIQLWHEPIALLSIPAMSTQVSALVNESQLGNSRVERMVEVGARLNDELSGQQAPWTENAVWEAADWIDATKKSIIDEAAIIQKETQELMRHADQVIKMTKRLVTGQRKKYAAHQVAISIFVLRAPNFHEQQFDASTPLPGSEMLRWVSRILSKNGLETNQPSLDLPSLLHSEGDIFDLYAYQGSLTRQPCTPNVRWFVAAQPLPSAATNIERLLEEMAASGQVTPFAAVIGGRDIQPSGPDRLVHKAQGSVHKFRRPPLFSANAASQATQKWTFVMRYGKVFFICSTLLMLTPLIIFGFRSIEKLKQKSGEKCDDDDARSRIVFEE